MKLIGLALTVLLLTNVGCRRSLRFQAVDAESGRPLAGVAVSRYTVFQDILLGTYSDRANIGNTDADGMIDVTGMKPGVTNNVTFRFPGYYDSVARWGLGSNKTAGIFFVADDLKLSGNPDADIPIVPVGRVLLRPSP